jgi:gluconolactonase
VVAADRLFPNGLAFDPTGSHLYLAQTFARVVERFTFRHGVLSSDGVFCELANGRPDGMAVDIDGNLWVCTPGTGGLEVFSAQGAPIRRLEFGAGTMTTNCCFGGPDMRQLFVTAAGQGAVLLLDVDTPGLPLNAGS